MQTTTLGLVVMAALVGGCSTTVIRTEQAKHVPSAQILEGFTLDQSDPVVIKRNDVFAASGCRFRVYADGKPIADLWRAEKVQFTLAAGRHVLSAEVQGALCAGQLKEVTVELRDKALRVFLLDAGLNNELVFQETAF